MPATVLQQDQLLIALDQAVRAEGRGGKTSALLLLGLGRLSYISWNLGLQSGDVILDNVAHRLKGLLPDIRMFKLWDSKFAILAQCDGATEAMNLAQRLVAVCSAPHAIGGYEVFSPPFVGVALAHDGHKNGAAMLRDAQFAMDDARSLHLGNARLCDPERKLKAERAFYLENGLRAAFETPNQFHVVYQPLVSLTSPGDITLLGFEALSRWTHPVYGAIPPDEFIPVSEECGLILGLGNYVLWEACKQQVQWAAATGRQVTMSVNLSVIQLMAETVGDTIAEAIAGTGIQPEYLKLEVTETALAANPQLIAERLECLRRMGVSVGVDDFGSGYSSLGQLDLFGLDFMKIDKSLVQRLGMGGRQTELVRLTIQLAKHLGMAVVAEGIEKPDDLETLIQLGVDIGQGYIFDRPLAPDQAMARILEHNFHPA